jgi:DNA-binding LacI/PurR family transcriptional regulator
MAQPTMQQVAERAGVSTALVSLVMRDAPNVSDHRRKRVLEAADELGYRPNVLARNLASRRTETIGIVLNDLHNPFFAEIADGLQAEADSRDYRLLFGNGKHSRAGEAEAVETFLQFRVDGIVLVGSLDVDTMEKAARSTAVVVVGRRAPSSLLDTVNTDDAIGARLVVEHLVALGHERIAHLDGGSGAGAAERSDGYVTAMRDHGLAQHVRIVHGDFTERGGHAGAAELLRDDEPPTAIFAGNDLSAVGALDYAMAAGLAVPHDISVVGYDNTALAAMNHLSLTTINQPTEDLGRAAINLLLERVNDARTSPVQFVRAPTLVKRNSSGPPRTGAVTARLHGRPGSRRGER